MAALELVAWLGDNGLVIAASYVTGSVSGTGKVGGTIIASYSTASVTSDGAVGGLVGGNFGNTGTATDSYWDTQTSGQSESAGGEGKTTSEFQAPEVVGLLVGSVNPKGNKRGPHRWITRGRPSACPPWGSRTARTVPDAGSPDALRGRTARHAATAHPVTAE